MKANNAKANGRVFATAGFVLGVVVSVAGNVAHTWYPTVAQMADLEKAGLTASDWKPEIGAQAFAAVFPIALFIVVEVLSRVDWPKASAWTLARFGGAGLVAVVAAVASYLHLHGLLRIYGEDALTAAIGPLAVDGLMIVSGVALLAIARQKQAALSPTAAPKEEKREEDSPLPSSAELSSPGREQTPALLPSSPLSSSPALSSPPSSSGFSSPVASRRHDVTTSPALLGEQDDAWAGYAPPLPVLESTRQEEEPKSGPRLVSSPSSSSSRRSDEDLAADLTTLIRKQALPASPTVAQVKDALRLSWKRASTIRTLALDSTGEAEAAS
ncbi:MAG: DUF2637 domain-containing protein [Arthrobacter sp.]|uniref:DUF2637 domain-containing protein n=1 Tax=Arthrobacter sp. TaxID=1667 RepID=UPI0034764300